VEREGFKMPVRMVKEARFFFEGKMMVAIEVSSGAMELYEVEEGGLEMFKGYIESPRISGALRLAACHAMYSKGSLAVTFACHYQLELPEMEVASG
jgi:hypothetical protein